MGYGESELAVHGRGATSDGLRSRHASHPTHDIHRHRAKPVAAVGHTGRGHRVGHQRQPIRTHAPAHVSIQRGVDVHTVGDQFDCHTGVFEQRDHRTGLAVIDRAHRVEQVRPHRRARRDRRPRLFIGRVGVAHRGDNARVDDSPDGRQRADPLRRQSDHPNRRTAHRENTVEFFGIRVAHQRRLVRTTPLGGQPRAFQMNPCDHTAPDILGQLPDLPYQIDGAGGDQRSNQHGGAVPNVQSCCGGGVGRGCGGEVRAAPAVHVGVDETRHHSHRPEVAICGTRRCP